MTTRPPSTNWFKGSKLDRDILPPSHSLANELYKPSVKVICGAATTEEEAEEVRSEVSSSSNVSNNASATCSDIKSDCGEARGSSLKWLKPTNTDLKEEKKAEEPIMTSSLKVFLEASNEEQEVRVIEQLSSQEFLVSSKLSCRNEAM